jgi:hypothetical protein
MMVAFRFAASSGVGVSVGAQRFEIPDTRGMSWHRGNTHAHSNRSVGKSSPLGLITWYRNNGYQFLVITDDTYPSAPELIAQSSDASFLLLPGMEIKAKSRTSWVHVNGINAPAEIRPVDGPTLLRTFQANVDAVRAAGGIPQLDHPRYMDGPDRETILASEGCSLMEIQNGVVGPEVPGENGYLSTETDWDWLLTNGKRVYGVCSDDTNTLRAVADATAPRPGQPGRGWIVVRAQALEPAAICRSLEKGLFYASSGVELADVSFEPTRISIGIKALEARTYSTSFIGDGGRIFLTTSQNPAIFDLAEKLTYVRAKVTDSAGKAAWTQPVFVQ